MLLRFSDGHAVFFAEDSLVFDHHVAVGHAGEVIADGPVQTDFLDVFLGADAQLFGMFEAVFEELLEHVDGACIGLMHDGVVVEIFVEVGTQLQV